MTDPMFPNIPMSVRNVAKWIALIGLILSSLFTVLGFISHRNGKKSVLKNIEFTFVFLIVEFNIIFF